MHPKTHFFSFELASSFQKWLTLFTFSKKNHINIYSIAQENVANWVLSSNWYKIDVIFKLVHRYLERYSYFGVMCRCVHSYLCVCMIPPRLIPSLSIFNRSYAISHQPWSFLWSQRVYATCCKLFWKLCGYAYQAMITPVFLISLKCLSPQDLLSWCFGFCKLNPLEKANLATEADHHRKH